MFNVISLSEARSNRLTRYFTGRPCKRGHICERKISDRSCVECNKIKVKKWRIEHKDQYKAIKRKWEVDNPDKQKAIKRRERIKNKDVYNASFRRRYKLNPEKIRTNSEKWTLKNPHKRAAYVRKRQARKLNSTPSWLNEVQLQEMENFYWLAKDLEKVTEGKYHVDHIVPLQGKNVCGLHVPWNLQVLPSDINVKKSNIVTI